MMGGDGRAARTELVDLRGGNKAVLDFPWSLEGQTFNSTLSRSWYWGERGFPQQLLPMLKGRVEKVGDLNYRSGIQRMVRIIASNSV